MKRRGALVGVLSAVGLVAGVFLVPAAVADNVRDAEAEADRLGTEVAVATEEYNQAIDRKSQATEELKIAEARMADQQRYIETLKADMGVVAVEAFKGGGVDPSLQMLTADPLAYLENAALLDAISQSQGATMARWVEALEQLEQDQAAVAASLAEIESLEQTLAARKADIERQLADAQEVLAEARRIQEERLASAQAASRDRDGGTGGASVTDASGAPVGMSCGDVSIQAPNPAAAAAIDFACAQVGKGYCWGGNGPGCFDCSGLTSQAWAAGGVSIPRSSREQYSALSKVSRSEIRPGDLVFFAASSSISHVGIAIGSGYMIDASRAGKPVEIQSIDREAQYLNYVGAGRP
ncbi:MAG: NlpC/P60 family protein [Actinomycetales bacterium]